MITKRIALIWITVVTAPLTGCVTIAEEMQAQVASIPKQQRSFIAGTFRVDCHIKGTHCNAPFNSISAYYYNVADQRIEGTLNVSERGIGNNTAYDILDFGKAVKGIYFCQPLPAGRYKLYSYSYWNFTDTGYTLRDENEFNVPFRTYSGEIVYIGDIRLTYAVGENIFGGRVHLPGVLVLSRGSIDDARKAILKCPEYSREFPLRSDPLEGDISGSKFVTKSQGY